MKLTTPEPFCFKDPGKGSVLPPTSWLFDCSLSLGYRKIVSANCFQWQIVCHSNKGQQLRIWGGGELLVESKTGMHRLCCPKSLVLVWQFCHNTLWFPPDNPLNFPRVENWHLRATHWFLWRNLKVRGKTNQARGNKLTLPGSSGGRTSSVPSMPQFSPGIYFTFPQTKELTSPNSVSNSQSKSAWKPLLTIQEEGRFNESRSIGNGYVLHDLYLIWFSFVRLFFNGICLHRRARTKWTSFVLLFSYVSKPKAQPYCVFYFHRFCK